MDSATQANFQRRLNAARAKAIAKHNGRCCCCGQKGGQQGQHQKQGRTHIGWAVATLPRTWLSQHACPGLLRGAGSERRAQCTCACGSGCVCCVLFGAHGALFCFWVVLLCVCVCVIEAQEENASWGVRRKQGKAAPAFLLAPCCTSRSSGWSVGVACESKAQGKCSKKKGGCNEGKVMN